jgi:hypothetical protein
MLKNLPRRLVYEIAFIAGMLHAAGMSLKEIADIVHAILRTIVSGRGVVSEIENIIDGIQNINLQDILEMIKGIEQLGEVWYKKCLSNDPWESGHSFGYAVGFILSEAGIAYISAGTVTGIKGTKWGQELNAIISKAKGLPKVDKYLSLITDRYNKIVARAGSDIWKRKKLLYEAALKSAGEVDQLSKRVIKKMVDLYHNRPLVLNHQNHHWIPKALIAETKTQHPHPLMRIISENRLYKDIDLIKVPWNQTKIPHVGVHKKQYFEFVEMELNRVQYYFKNSEHVWTKVEMEETLQKVIIKTKESIINDSIRIYDVID